MPAKKKLAPKKAAPKKTPAAKKAPRGPTEMEQRFASFYLEDFDASAAYRRAAPGKVTQRTAQVNGSKMLARPIVRELIKQQRDKVLARSELTIETVMAQLKNFLTYDPRALFDAKGQLRPMTEWPAEVAGAVIGIKDTMAGREVKLVDKSATLEKALPTTDKREALNAVWAWWKVDHPEQPEQQGAIAT